MRVQISPRDLGRSRLINPQIIQITHLTQTELFYRQAHGDRWDFSGFFSANFVLSGEIA
jgi:hypothetical protein